MNQVTLRPQGAQAASPCAHLATSLLLALLLICQPADAQTVNPVVTPSAPAPASARSGALDGSASAGGATNPASEDPYLWLEALDDAQTRAWAAAQNARTQTALEQDPRYPELLKEATGIAQSNDRLPAPSLVGQRVLDFWRDAAHTRGIWRVATLASFTAGKPSWKTILDLDELAAREKANWVWKGFECEPARASRCMVYLSDGGEDAIEAREFDLERGALVSGGFMLPKAKLSAAWLDADTLLVASDWGPGSLTESGYPYIVRRWRRGQPLAEAPEVFRGKPQDMGIELLSVRDGRGRSLGLVRHMINFFESETLAVTPSGVRLLPLPRKHQTGPLVDGQLIVRLTQDWERGVQHFTTGSVIALDAARAVADAETVEPQAIFTPGPRESVQEMGATRSTLLLLTLDNVRGRAWELQRHPNGTWSRHPLALPDNATLNLEAAEPRGDAVIYRVEGFLEPPSLWVSRGGAPHKVMAQPAQFRAGGLVVEQFEAESADGTHVPYFVVHPKQLLPGGANPAILWAYGGFEIAMTPRYNGTRGKLWLERGGSFVLANIRGGGEFGPAWHDAGLKTRRQRIYDDFAAVARDLDRRGIADARHLGISGGSNGGLLMGVEMTQHPELFQAVEIAVPLLDMLRFEKIQAGASWVGEYGSVSVPEERAFLAGISPYAQLRRGQAYPEPLIWTTTKDDRVGPQHARKFAARMAEFGLPYWYYEVTEGGHGAGANLAEEAHTRALAQVYFMRRLMGTERPE
jgi:prolyl oligopeptidase